MLKEPFIGNFSEHERRVYRSQDPNALQATPQDNQRTQPSGIPVVDGVPVDFLSQWEAYIAQSSHPGIYDTSHKALALLGYHWGVQAVQSFTRKIDPTPSL